MFFRFFLVPVLFYTIGVYHIFRRSVSHCLEIIRFFEGIAHFFVADAMMRFKKRRNPVKKVANLLDSLDSDPSSE